MYTNYTSSKTAISMVETFFNWYDANTWIEGNLEDFPADEYTIEQCSINLMPSGGYRAGFVVSKRQQEMEI